VEVSRYVSPEQSRFPHIANMAEAGLYCSYQLSDLKGDQEKVAYSKIVPSSLIPLA
jgi:hypothetical protein